MAKRSFACKACGATVRVRPKDLSVGAAVRKHYWKRHPEIMLAARAEADWPRPEPSGGGQDPKGSG